MLTPKLVEARHVRGFVLHLRFADGAEGDVDFSGEIDGEVFEPLKDVEYFRQFTIHPEFHTLAWPNGADFAPEFLYEQVHVTT